MTNVTIKKWENIIWSEAKKMQHHNKELTLALRRKHVRKMLMDKMASWQPIMEVEK